ncbi:type VI secretion system tube protein TssD [Pseudomonas sp. UM16]|uniref:type VI secretion system tube protein TssD n=1 Tax=Pseudomonas sp. UM16 TaxID=3158962 RepID=UPI00398FB3F3
MAHHGYLSITGKKQGLISAGCSGLDSIANKCQSGHLDEIMVLSFAHNLSNLDNTKHATHHPLIIIKYIDKSTPLLAQAVASREVVDCTLNFYRVSLSGQEAQEHLAIRYRDISWSHHTASTSGHASWGVTPWDGQ